MSTTAPRLVDDTLTILEREFGLPGGSGGAPGGSGGDGGVCGRGGELGAYGRRMPQSVQSAP
eukprot:1954720-Prymnesium_polylepis.2